MAFSVKALTKVQNNFESRFLQKYYIITILNSFWSVSAISYLRIHGPPSLPPSRSVQILQKIWGGGPSSDLCKNFLRGDPYYSLHISEEGGPSPSKMCKICLPCTFFLQGEGPTTLVTWVPQNRQGKLAPSLRGCSAPPPFKWES